MLLHDLVGNMVDVIIKRAQEGKNYGVVLIPEGIIQFIPSMKSLIDSLNHLLQTGSQHLAALEDLPVLLCVCVCVCFSF